MTDDRFRKIRRLDQGHTETCIHDTAGAGGTLVSHVRTVETGWEGSRLRGLFDVGEGFGSPEIFGEARVTGPHLPACSYFRHGVRALALKQVSCSTELVLGHWLS